MLMASLAVKAPLSKRVVIIGYGMIKRAQVAGKVKINANSVDLLIMLLLSLNRFFDEFFDYFVF